MVPKRLHDLTNLLCTNRIVPILIKQFECHLEGRYLLLREAMLLPFIVIDVATSLLVRLEIPDTLLG